jgi:hypothetical protein
MCYLSVIASLYLFISLSLYLFTSLPLYLSQATFAPSLRIIRLRAEFTIDANGKLWHTHCSSVVGQDMAAPTPDPVQQAAMSVQLAAEAEGKLRKL